MTVPATHPTTGATPQPMTGTAGVVPEPRRRRGGLAALLFVLLLLAATVGLLWKLGILSGTGTPATPAPTTTPVPAVTTATTTTEEPTPTATTTTRRPRRTSPAHTRTATTRPTVTVTETPRTPTDTPTDVSPTPDPTWTTAATASVGALRQAVDAATLPKPLERDVNSTLDRLSGAVDKADAAAARDAIGELDSTLREAAEQGVVDDGTETLVTGALNAVNQLLPPA